MFAYPWAAPEHFFSHQNVEFVKTHGLACCKAVILVGMLVAWCMCEDLYRLISCRVTPDASGSMGIICALPAMQQFAGGERHIRQQNKTPNLLLYSHLRLNLNLWLDLIRTTHLPAARLHCLCAQAALHTRHAFLLIKHASLSLHLNIYHLPPRPAPLSSDKQAQGTNQKNAI